MTSHFPFVLAATILSAAPAAAAALPDTETSASDNSSPDASAPQCPGRTTIEINECLYQDFETADAERKRYASAALKRMKDSASEFSDAMEAEAPGAFLAAEKAWEDYREHECGALYYYWSSGTIRGAMSLTCRIALTRQRTHVIWQNWLTFPDDSTPVMPEPEVTLP